MVHIAGTCLVSIETSKEIFVDRAVLWAKSWKGYRCTSLLCLKLAFFQTEPPLWGSNTWGQCYFMGSMMYGFVAVGAGFPVLLDVTCGLPHTVTGYDHISWWKKKKIHTHSIDLLAYGWVKLKFRYSSSFLYRVSSEDLIVRVCVSFWCLREVTMSINYLSPFLHLFYSLLPLLYLLPFLPFFSVSLSIPWSFYITLSNLLYSPSFSSVLKYYIYLQLFFSL